MTIHHMQNEIQAAGWQWEEHIYNDGNPRNCSIKFAKSKDPLVFLNSGVGDVGWGRFERSHAWQQAYAWIVLGSRERDPCQ